MLRSIGKQSAGNPWERLYLPFCADSKSLLVSRGVHSRLYVAGDRCQPGSYAPDTQLLKRENCSVRTDSKWTDIRRMNVTCLWTVNRQLRFVYSYIPLDGPDRTRPDQTKSADFIGDPGRVGSGPVRSGRVWPVYWNLAVTAHEQVDPVTRILFENIHTNIFALEMASRGNRHCANCIGTLSFPIGHARQRHDCTSCWLAAAKLGRSVLR